MSENKCVVIGVTGGIAAYKVCNVVSSLHKQGYEVHVIMTEGAQKFVTPLTFQTLSGQKVITDMFTVDYTCLWHIRLTVLSLLQRQQMSLPKWHMASRMIC